MERKTRDEKDEFRRKLKEEWQLVWQERFDDKIKAEGIAIKDYPLLFMDRGSVIFASRAARMPTFSEIIRIWASRGAVYSPDPSEGGWGKFVRTEIRNVAHSRAAKCAIDKHQLDSENGHMKKGGRGWLHIK